MAAAPATTSAPPAVQKIRYSQTQDRVRIVFDMDVLPEYNASLVSQSPETNPDDLLRLVVDFSGTITQGVVPQMLFDDGVVNSLNLSESEAGKLSAVVDLKSAAAYKVFTLSSPNRLVIDIIKGYDRKVQQEVMPGLKYTYLVRSLHDGPLTAYILDIDPAAGYGIKPALSNDEVVGLETLSPIAERASAVAAINGSYFALSGDILGLLKIDGKIVSTPSLPRTAMGVMPDGKVLIDQVDYQGRVTLPDGQQVAIGGVDCERGPNSLILYNSYYNDSTGTNNYGIEYSIDDDKVTKISQGNTAIAPGGMVLSAHGTAADALVKLKVGDTVKIQQTLGSALWDKTLYALGAGPTLVKNGGVYLTTTAEEFGSDVAGGRAPRTALGVTKDGHVLLVVLDGRQSNSIGLTLLELAKFMQELGSVDAMNLDGGGSSEMVIKGKVVNKPSDGRERRIGDALLVIPSKSAI